jgi:hypothetical protein
METRLRVWIKRHRQNDWAFAGIYLGVTEQGIIWVAPDQTLGCTAISETKVEYLGPSEPLKN